jgi:hypothetical protein
MSITVGRHTFEGPYTDTGKLEDRSGVYAIHCYRDLSYYLVDVGESAKVRERVDNHERRDCWQLNCSGVLTFSVLYTPSLQQPGRMAIEQAIRGQFNPPCGQR